jgi:pyruvate dehydrogenase E2 component (dihydrolipoyllysine-residue acetyltransferase)
VAFAIIMPKAGMAMETGTIVGWLKKEGETVLVGEPILEIETDKVVMEVEAEFAGVLLKITHGEGDEVPVTATIGYIGEAGESIAELPRETPAPGTTSASVAPVRSDADHPSGHRGAPAQPQQPQQPAPQTPPGHPGRSGTQVFTSARGRVAATPAARRQAAEAGIPLDQLHPSGDAGQVRLRDVPSTPPAPEGGVREPAGFAPSVQSPPGRREPLSAMRRAIADAMTRSQRIPQYTLHADVGLDRVLTFRARFEEIHGDRPGLTTIIVKALGLALADAPGIAACIDGESLVHPDRLGIGIAVSVPGGIVVPVIHRVAEMTIGELDDEVRRLVERAQAGQLSAVDLQDAVTTVSNLGAFGVTRFTPMITPPQSSVLGVSAVRTVPAIVGDAVIGQSVLGLDLTVDHRVTDGADAARFIQTVVRRLEDPESLSPTSFE